MFMTGKYTVNIGLQDSVLQATEPRGLSLDEDLLPARLAAVGYRTIGVSIAELPNERVNAKRRPRGGGALGPPAPRARSHFTRVSLL
jgi:hypothetical protein